MRCVSASARARALDAEIRGGSKKIQAAGVLVWELAVVSGAQAAALDAVRAAAISR
ncbi:hypothetical protein G6O69_08345 [Pseudenhygromyxa sp. WMMC2535]|uniref:hypothetical protein n=1 Tax=Pseudenhygromyxa sp. WMMC2535 TaxID=2712867 RepID=UPI001595AA09|nr:hypothetical protein [Pseudenhygromyxa sp. WMMC2535]NVB37841.1 hypothetical protein [Pseudenhygromyxa sp. WMMC2535]